MYIYMPAMCRSIPKRVTSVFRLFELTFSCPRSFSSSLLSYCLQTYSVYHTAFLSAASFSSLIINIFNLSVPLLLLFHLPIVLFLAFLCCSYISFLSSLPLLLHFSPRPLIRFFSSTFIMPHYIHLTKEILEVSLQSVSFFRSQVDGNSLCLPKYLFNPVRVLAPTQTWPYYNYSPFVSWLLSSPSHTSLFFHIQCLGGSMHAIVLPLLSLNNIFNMFWRIKCNT